MKWGSHSESTAVSSKQSGAENSVCKRARESMLVLVVVSANSTKKAVADHSFVDERKTRDRKEHWFILSFSILLLGPLKITSYLILVDKQLEKSFPSSPLCLCVSVYPFSLWLLP